MLAVAAQSRCTSCTTPLLGVQIDVALLHVTHVCLNHMLLSIVKDMCTCMLFSMLGVAAYSPCSGCLMQGIISLHT